MGVSGFYDASHPLNEKLRRQLASLMILGEIELVVFNTFSSRHMTL